MPPGYYTTYGGQFQNLVEANKRLSVALPIALGLIFMLLFFTFKSIKQSVLILQRFRCQPLEEFCLMVAWNAIQHFCGHWICALFGVAVLNGIVLIGYFNQLKKEGMKDVWERIQEGTKVRLRPVIMTASVASLGFLPMALSTGSGAEVQKPLATVVIGGLITATLLTLIILPILYYFLEQKFKGKKKNLLSIVPVLLILLIWERKVNAQSYSLPQILEIAQRTIRSLRLICLKFRCSKL